MKKYFQTATLLSITSLLLSACGGGGGGSTEVETTSTTAAKSSIESPTTTTTSSTTAKVMDASAVEGLSIKCASQTLLTQKDGSFECTTLPIDISLGSYKLATLKSINYDRIILTQDIINQPRGAIVFPEVTKLSMLLQSLDKDATLSNGIQLTPEILEIADSYLGSTPLSEISFDELETMIDDIISDVTSNDATLHLQAVTATQAQTNLATTTANLPALSAAQRSIGRL